MGSSLYHLRFAILCCFHLIILTNSFSSAQPLCHEDESSALLQFKRSFFLDDGASTDQNAYPKVESWKLINGNASDCCSWDGVECDHDSGHVTGLDLNSSFLYGSINSNSSLFRLAHLRRLNLADNHFNFSQIPPTIRFLSRLTSLNLSHSFFYGQIPFEILELSLLTSLDLSHYDQYYGRFLTLQNPSLTNLVENLTKLNELHVNGVNVHTTVPDMLLNMTSLTGLGIYWCRMVGEFPGSIFHLPNLKVLSAGRNNFTGTLPEFHSGSHLEVLKFDSTFFSGTIPDSIGRLQALTYLNLGQNSFSGPIPTSLGNLTRLTTLGLRMSKFSGQVPSSLANLSQLTVLSLGDNSFDAGTLPLVPGKLHKLTYLFFSEMNLVGEIPISLANLTKLSFLALSYNNLVGKIPSLLMNLTQLTTLDLSDNHLDGMIPTTISQLKNLEELSLALNSLTGIVELDVFMNLKNLVALQLGENKLTVLTKNIANGTLPKFNTLGLGACNLIEFPDFLRSQHELQLLFFSNNKIHSQIPTWVWNRSKETLEVVDFSHNFLTGFEQHPGVIPWGNLKYMDLSSNKLQGSLPTPPPGTTIYKVNDNQLTGEIPPSICNINSLLVLDLSDNNLSGTIPPCLANSSDNLLMLNLSHNSLHGSNLPSEYFQHWKAMKMANGERLKYMQAIPELTYITTGGPITHVSWFHTVFINYSYSITIASKGTQRLYEKIQSAFVAVDLSNNKFSGEIPESLGSLNGLQLLNISRNTLDGVIPSSLASLTKLESLDLSRNELSGKIPQQLTQLTFLAVLNLSQNRLTGPIPQGKQFDTFENTSYNGNPGLCGVPLSTLCENSEALPPPRHSSQGNETEFSDGIYWMVIFMGYGSGLIVGLVIGTTLTRRYHDWFVETFGSRKKIQKKQKGNGRMN